MHYELHEAPLDNRDQPLEYNPLCYLLDDLLLFQIAIHYYLPIENHLLARLDSWPIHITCLHQDT